MGLKNTVSGVILGVLLCVSQAHAEKRTIIWTLNDFIPFFIKEGPFREQGISDKLTHFFQQRLPDYNHQQEQMNFSRFFVLAKRGELVCNPLLLKTSEREKILAYSQPFKPAYAHVMVSTHPVGKPGEPISFEQFLKTDTHGLIVQTKRSYGPILDKVIKKARDQGRIQDHVYPTKQLFVMLEKGRIDHFVDIENSAVYYRSLRPGNIKLYQIPLMEDRLDRFGYAVCSKTPAGQELIAKIDKIIDQEKASPEFRAIVESWMAEENLPRFRAFYDREILGK